VQIPSLLKKPVSQLARHSSSVPLNWLTLLFVQARQLVPEVQEAQSVIQSVHTSGDPESSLYFPSGQSLTH
jgi:hypothetical protein